METVKDIRESGLIEYYVLDILSQEERSQVEKYLIQFPELQKDYLEIQAAMQSYAQSQNIIPRKGLSNDITNYINENSANKINKGGGGKSGSSSNLFKFLTGILGLVSVGALWFAFQKDNQIKEIQNEYAVYQSDCDSTVNAQNEKLSVLEFLNNPDNNSLEITPTDNYSNTKLILHSNPNTRRNFLQVNELPTINRDQAFQLWSLKDGQNPIPMNVFTLEGEIFIPLDFEEGTKTYAITIEQAGGSQVPTLTRLIGTVNV
ncbi:MAG: anti-sigma factor [Saprospiraceae bacterium]|nr:anti-sigma factor [Bacteroidia bacterium]NNL93238.1 anti-sigma factor [Saprospiraceae bacterium]